MKYYSTRDKAHARPCSLREAVEAGLAPDGGLFVPERIPQADMAVAERLAGESYAALAGYLAALFFGEDIDAGILQREIGRIYDFQVPLRPVGSRYTLELFHGPTFAFKDFGAGFMGRMVGLQGGADEKLVILTATSGDTGSLNVRFRLRVWRTCFLLTTPARPIRSDFISGGISLEAMSL